MRLGPNFLRAFLGPNSDEFAGCAMLDEANRDEAGINEEIKFDVAEGCHPLGPLDLCGQAGCMNRARRERSRREGKATSARSSRGFRRYPRKSIMGSQVCFQGKLQLRDSRRRHERGKGTRDIGNSM